MAKRFAGIAAQLLRTANVRLYHDQALVKEIGAAATPWHQDYYYWPLDTVKTITMWMPLVDCPRDLGTMTFAEGTHLPSSHLELHPISESAHQYFEQYVKNKELPLHTYDMSAGDATFHFGTTLHCAHGNSSPAR